MIIAPWADLSLTDQNEARTTRLAIENRKVELGTELLPPVVPRRAAFLLFAGSAFANRHLRRLCPRSPMQQLLCLPSNSHRRVFEQLDECVDYLFVFARQQSLRGSQSD